MIPGLPQPDANGRIRMKRSEAQAALGAIADKMRDRTVELARTDPVVFCAHVMRDEKTGERIELQPVHVAMIGALTGHRAPGEPAPDPRRNIVVTGAVSIGKTQIAIACAVWLSARHAVKHGVPLRIAFGSDTDTVAANMAAQAAGYIEAASESAKACREVFPEFGRGSKWGPDTGYRLTWDGKEPHVKDPAIRSFGLKTNILSTRVDLMVLDDLVTQDNTLTPHRRAATIEKLDGTLRGRVEDDGRIWFLCNAFWEDDAASVVAGLAPRASGDAPRKVAFQHFALPVAEGSPDAWHAFAMKAAGEPPGRLNWAARWPLGRIVDAILTNTRWKQTLFCVRRRKVEGNRFRGVIDKALAVGRGLPLLFKLDSLPDGAVVAEGVDMAFSEASTADKNALVPIMQTEDGMLRPLWIETDRPDLRWTSSEFFAKLREHRERYWCRHVVESVGAQKWIAEQAAVAHGLDVSPCNTTGDKKQNRVLGVESLADLMAMGGFALPCEDDGTVHPMLVPLIEQMEAYDPTPGVHTGDELMATWMAVRNLRMSSFAYAIATAGEVETERLASPEREPPEEHAGRYAVSTADDRDDRSDYDARYRHDAAFNTFWRGYGAKE